MAEILRCDGNTIKAIDFTPWGGIDGFLSATSGGGYDNRSRLRSLVPWLNKGVTMTGNAVSQLPYSIEDVKGNEIDPDVAWGGISDPRRFIKLVADALCGGAAYLAVETTKRGIVSMQYILPSTMTVNFDKAGNVESFKRTYANGKPADNLKPENVIYFWLPDDTVETGPAYLHPLANATLPAQLMAGMDSSLKAYSERGFIPPTLLGVKGLPEPSEVTKIESVWNAFLRGWSSFVAKVMNTEVLTPITLGAGMDELRGSYTEITRQQIENIAAAFDIPMSLFMSNAANYATASSDRRTWYETGVFVSIYQTIEDALNVQLFSRFGWHFEFEPEQLPEFQEVEADRSGAISTLTSTLASNPIEFLITCDILGLELTDEQIEKVEALVASDNEPEPLPDVVTQMPSDNTEPMMEDAADAADDMMGDELGKWYRAAKSKPIEKLKSDILPGMLQERIKIAVKAGRPVDDVFADAAQELHTIALAKAINKLAAK